MGNNIDVKHIWNNSYLTCGYRSWKWRKVIAVNFPIYAIGKKEPEKIRASTGFEPVTSANTGAMLYQLSYEATRLRAGSLFSWSVEQNARECTRAWMKARDGKLPGYRLVSRVSRLRCSTLDALSRAWLTEEKRETARSLERLLTVYEATRGQFVEFISSREEWNDVK